MTFTTSTPSRLPQEKESVSAGGNGGRVTLTSTRSSASTEPSAPNSLASALIPSDGGLALLNVTLSRTFPLPDLATHSTRLALTPDARSPVGSLFSRLVRPRAAALGSSAGGVLSPESTGHVSFSLSAGVSNMDVEEDEHAEEDEQGSRARHEGVRVEEEDTGNFTDLFGCEPEPLGGIVLRLRHLSWPPGEQLVHGRPFRAQKQFLQRPLLLHKQHLGGISACC